MQFLEYLRIRYKHQGRGWQEGDCFNLLLLFYQKELGISLPDFPEDYLEEWGKAGSNYFLDLYHQWGFRQAEEPYQFGDGILFTTRFGVTHCGVITDPEQRYFLHTSRRGTSINSYGIGEWASRAHSVYRYSDADCIT